MGLGSTKLEKTISTDFPGDDRYYGFENYGNTCYGNSVLQTLYHCGPFREQMIEYYLNKVKEHSDSEENLLASLCELFYSVNSQKKRTGVFGPRKFFARLRKENEMFRGYMHQDAHEFLNYTLNEIAEKLEKKEGSKENTNKEESTRNGGKTIVHKIFGGILTNQTKCLTCETKTSRDESFLDLSLDVEQNSSITSCLKHFSQTEMLAGDDKFYCDTCHSKQEAERGIKIKKLPSILVLHLKRFKYIEQVQSYKKLFHRVVFPFELRLQNTTEETEDSERLYKLFAVVIHIGAGPSHGHYVCTIKSHNHWILFDDENIDIIDENEIRQLFGHTTETISYDRPKTECGYLLFYQSISTEDDAVLSVDNGPKLLNPVETFPVGEKDPYCI